MPITSFSWKPCFSDRQDYWNSTPSPTSINTMHSTRAILPNSATNTSILPTSIHSVPLMAGYGSRWAKAATATLILFSPSSPTCAISARPHCSPCLHVRALRRLRNYWKYRLPLTGRCAAISEQKSRPVPSV